MKRDTPAQHQARRDLLRAERVEAVTQEAHNAMPTPATELALASQRAHTERCLEAVTRLFPGEPKRKP